MRTSVMSGVIAVLCVLSGDSAWSQTVKVPSRWVGGPVILTAGEKGSFDDVAVKDPTIVCYQGKWHLFYTVSGKEPGGIGYVSAESLDLLATAPRHKLNQFHGQTSDSQGEAPQVFFFEPQKLWYLIYQTKDFNRQPVYSTTPTIDKPESWSRTRNLIVREEPNVKWIDFWVICDDANAYFFYSRGRKDVYVRQTKLEDFPNGFGPAQLAFSPMPEPLTEAVHIYKVKDKTQYHMFYETRPEGEKMRRYGLATASNLPGPWRRVADDYAVGNKLVFDNPADRWTDEVSHGEMIRTGCNQKLEYDPAEGRFLIQGLRSKEHVGEYRRLGWRLGIITPVYGDSRNGPANTFFVALNGNDSNGGTEDRPFGSLEKAIETVQPGGTILIRGGTYPLARRVNLSKDGSEGKRISLCAYPGEQVILDFSNAGDSSHGLKVNGSFWRLKGLVIQKAGGKGIRVSGSNNLFEQIVTRNNGDSGIKLDDGAADNMVLNCDSYLNYDKATQGSNADGFAAKHGLGKGNAFIGCRAWNNSDDGFDFMEAGSATRVENCWSWGNGQNIWGDAGFDGNGVGFKLGDGPGKHVIIRCLVWANAKSGFNIQGNTSSVTLYNNTAWNNRRDYFFDDSHPHKLRNNVSFEGEVVMWPGIDHANNSWNGGCVVTREDFLSLDDGDMKGPRNADGGLPESNFLRLAPDSDLIDRGVDVGLAFEGAAPDLGAFETPIMATKKP
ncbi:MAG TPA: non-reducing end alpha-L-arabinofuranosidase family hydrolase [Sedimentisphaerales bacterium]|nr:non-reducing end alpha-L-arabinofuranosidase family hydrolase [Sedimentisphaerales bacterium]